MATVMRNMTMGQNIHMMQNNCVMVSSNKSSVLPSQVIAGTHLYHHGKRPIAPATESRNSSSVNGNVLMSKSLSGDNSSLKCVGKAKKYNYGAAANMPYNATQTPSVARRNARERNRVKLVNNGFANLRQHIPPAIAASTVQASSRASNSSGTSKKLSKVDTLRLAVEYIRSLQQILDENENDPTRTMANCSQGSVSSTASNSSYYSVASPNNHQLACSEPSSSPTPSYTSEGSLGPITYSSEPSGHFKSEPYDNYADPSSSPTPSYQSDGSTGYQHPHHHQHHNYHHHHHPAHQEPITPVAYKQPSFAFTPMSSEDEDLLDAISWWQQQ